jgi:hypothetical protein
MITDKKYNTALKHYGFIPIPPNGGYIRIEKYNAKKYIRENQPNQCHLCSI